MDTRKNPGPIRPGDTVRIVSGAAAGVKGIVSRISKGTARVVNLFHGVYEVPVSCLERQEGSEGRTP